MYSRRHFDDFGFSAGKLYHPAFYESLCRQFNNSYPHFEANIWDSPDGEYFFPQADIQSRTPQSEKYSWSNYDQSQMSFDDFISMRFRNEGPKVPIMTKCVPEQLLSAEIYIAEVTSNSKLFELDPDVLNKYIVPPARNDGWCCTELRSIQSRFWMPGHFEYRLTGKDHQNMTGVTADLVWLLNVIASEYEGSSDYYRMIEGHS